MIYNLIPGLAGVFMFAISKTRFKEGIAKKMINFFR